MSRLNSFLRSSTSSPEPENNNSDVIKSKSCYWARVVRVAKYNWDRGQMVSTARRIVICSDSYYNNYKIQGKGGLDPSLIPDPTCGVDIRLSPTIRFVKKRQVLTKKETQRQKYKKRKLTIKDSICQLDIRLSPTIRSVKKDKYWQKQRHRDKNTKKQSNYEIKGQTCELDIRLSPAIRLVKKRQRHTMPKTKTYTMQKTKINHEWKTLHVMWGIDTGLSFFLLLLSSLTMQRIIISMLAVWMIPKSKTIAHHLWEERYHV